MLDNAVDHGQLLGFGLCKPVYLPLHMMSAVHQVAESSRKRFIQISTVRADLDGLWF